MLRVGFDVHPRNVDQRRKNDPGAGMAGLRLPDTMATFVKRSGHRYEVAEHTGSLHRLYTRCRQRPELFLEFTPS
jgi:hypothetical protein